MRKVQNLVLQGNYNRPILVDVHFQPSAHPQPVLIFCHGYKGFKDWGAWNLMCNQFAANGICTVKFNFSHNGGTKDQSIDFPDLEAFAQNNYSIELDDLKIVIDWVKSNAFEFKDHCSEEIILMGHSRGGGICSIMAAEDSRIVKLIGLASVSDFKARFDVGSEAFLKWQSEGVKYILNGRTKQQMPHYFQFYEDFAGNEERLTIKNAIKDLSIPHLIIHGDADTSVPLDEGKTLSKWNDKARLEIIADADHVFNSRHPWEFDHLPDEMTDVVRLVTKFVNT